MYITEHFQEKEFACKCGCNRCEYDDNLVKKLEKLRTMLNSPVIIVSGYRCYNHDKAVGGTGVGTHTRGIAADIQSHGKTSADIAEAAEKCGFSGIGIISDTNCHVDIRNKYNYVNSHWFGDERTGNDNIKTFIRNKNTLKYITNITLNGVKYKMTMEEIT